MAGVHNHWAACAGIDPTQQRMGGGLGRNPFRSIAEAPWPHKSRPWIRPPMFAYPQYTVDVDLVGSLSVNVVYSALPP